MVRPEYEIKILHEHPYYFSYDYLLNNLYENTCLLLDVFIYELVFKFFHTKIFTTLYETSYLNAKYDAYGKYD